MGYVKLNSFLQDANKTTNLRLVLKVIIDVKELLEKPLVCFINCTTCMHNTTMQIHNAAGNVYEMYITFCQKSFQDCPVLHSQFVFGSEAVEAQRSRPVHAAYIELQVWSIISYSHSLFVPTEPRSEVPWCFKGGTMVLVPCPFKVVCICYTVYFCCKLTLIFMSQHE